MSYFSHENIAVLLPGRLPKGYWEVHRIKDMRVMDGKREWLIVQAKPTHKSKAKGRKSKQYAQGHQYGQAGGEGQLTQHPSYQGHPLHQLRCAPHAIILCAHERARHRGR